MYITLHLMLREQFVRENPEKAAKQEREWTQWILRVIAIAALWASATFGTYSYLNNPWVTQKVDTTMEKIVDWAMTLITDIENPGTVR